MGGVIRIERGVARKKETEIGNRVGLFSNDFFSISKSDFIACFRRINYGINNTNNPIPTDCQ